MEEELSHVNMQMDERAVRALLQAVCFTMEKWTGQEPIDQEEMYCLRPFLQGAVLEFTLARSPE